MLTLLALLLTVAAIATVVLTLPQQTVVPIVPVMVAACWCVASAYVLWFVWRGWWRVAAVVLIVISAIAILRPVTRHQRVSN